MWSKLSEQHSEKSDRGSLFIANIALEFIEFAKQIWMFEANQCTTPIEHDPLTMCVKSEGIKRIINGDIDVFLNSGSK